MLLQAVIQGPWLSRVPLSLKHASRGCSGFNTHPANRKKVGKDHIGGSYSPNVQVAHISSPTSHWLKVHLLPSLDEKMTRTMVSGGSATFREQLSKRGTQNFGGKLATEDKGQRWDPEYLGVKL